MFTSGQNTQPVTTVVHVTYHIMYIAAVFIIIIIIIISFIKGIYTYIPETNHVPREYSVSAILSLLFMVSVSLVPALALLYFYVRTFRSMCAVPNYYYYHHHHHHHHFVTSVTSLFSTVLLLNQR